MGIEEDARGRQEEEWGDQKVDRVRQQGEVGTWLEGLRSHQRQEARGQGALCQGQGLVRPGVGSDLEVNRSRQDAWSFMVLCACPCVCITRNLECLRTTCRPARVTVNI